MKFTAPGWSPLDGDAGEGIWQAVEQALEALGLDESYLQQLYPDKRRRPSNITVNKHLQRQLKGAGYTRIRWTIEVE